MSRSAFPSFPGMLALAVLLLPAAAPGFSGGRPQEAPAPTEFLPTITTAPTRCRERYRELFPGHTIELRVAFGYKDARPARFVGDGYERAMLVAYLEAPCRDAQTACGFGRAPDDADLFTKEIPAPGGGTRIIRLRVVHSAVGPDDDENRKDPFQSWRSRYAEETFLQGLRAADVVLYNGHSRDGGGPDFTPPRLRAAQHVDYPQYHVDKPGLVTMRRTFAEGPSRVKLLGLFSCASTGHFVKDVRKARPGLAMITNRRLLYYADALRSLLATLSALLGQWCPSDLDWALGSESVGGTTHVSGLFDGIDFSGALEAREPEPALREPTSRDPQSTVPERNP